MRKGKYKIFQDATQGYIEIEDVYIRNLIDTIYVQREKNVSQVGIRSVFSGATHDRFSHSIGVYGMGTKMYAAFKNSAEIAIGNAMAYLQTVKGCKDEQVKNIESQLIKLIDNFEVVYIIACLLHDIGHPAFSHTLEYLYNNDFIPLGSEILVSTVENRVEDYDYIIKGDEWKEEKTIQINIDEVKRLLKRDIWRKKREKELDSKKEEESNTYLIETLKSILNREENGQNYGLHIKASPHEVMGALQILTVNNLRERIQNILEDKDIVFPEVYAFIARMITGTKYDIRQVIAANQYEDTAFIQLEYSLRNCVIALLNGVMDADSMDYLNRNAHFSGYATNNLDVSRLCNAFKIDFDTKTGTFRPCIAKSALSSLEDFIQARNFEPKWLYAHHKIVYFNEVLITYLMKIGSVYMYADIQKELERNFLECIFEDSAIFDAFFSGLSYLKWKELYIGFLKEGTKQEYTVDDYRNTIQEHTERLCKLIPLDKYDDTIRNLLKDTEQNKSIYLQYDILSFIGFTQRAFNKIINEGKISANDINDIKIFTKYTNDFIKRLEYMCTNYLLSPIISFSLDKKIKFFKSTDSNIEAFFHAFFLSMENIKETQYVNAPRLEMFKDMLMEFKTRKYRKSLWKTFNEYKIFIQKVATKTFLPWDLVHQEFIELIQSTQGSEHCIELEDEVAAQESYKDKKKINCIYVNCESIELPKGLEKQKTINCNFDSVFKPLGDKMIIRLHKCSFKNFNELNIQFGSEIKKYREVGDYKTPKSIIFPYIYYNDSQEKEILLTQRIEELADRFEKYIATQIDSKKVIVRGKAMDNQLFLKGKVIRDSVHGDIFVAEKYLDIMNTVAFQRLHRIRQLATANMVFPEAVHTRFAHSLGTFHVMNLIMKHFCGILDELKIDYTSENYEVVLVAALLHDIGHGPFSHALEGIKKIDGSDRPSHEAWTVKIIERDVELQSVLLKHFGKGFSQKVINCLKGVDERNAFSKVFHELISSNLDADRLDYLLRDSYNTGEKIGTFDLQKLISAMQLTEYNGQRRIAISIGALEYVDQYILGRYHMYSSVYYAPFKLATEELFRRLCKIVVNYPSNSCYEKEKVKKAIDEIKKLTIYKLCMGTITIEEYLALDDYSIVNEIKSGLYAIGKAENKRLYASLAESFMYRNDSYQRKRIGHEDKKSFCAFQDYMLKRFPNFNNLYSVIALSDTFSAYKKDTDKEILIVSNIGEVVPYSKCSKFANNFDKNNKLFFSEYNYYYFNKTICAQELEGGEKENESFANMIDSLFEAYDLRQHTEIENKYYCDEYTLNMIIRELKKGICIGQYEILKDSVVVQQDDIYYDTNSLVLAKNGYSLRFRNIEGKHILTIKKPGIVSEAATETQFIRLEFEKECSEHNISSPEAITIINENDLVGEFEAKGIVFDCKDLCEVLSVSNKRNTFKVQQKDSKKILFEIALDNVKYKNLKDGKIKQVYQVEIELKESYLYRVNLNDFANGFCNKFNIAVNGKRPKVSKYVEALELFGIIDTEKKN